MYKIIEMQTNNGITAHIVTDKATQNEAESDYYRVMSAVAVSNVEVHACVVLSEDGTVIKSGCYRHES